MSRHMGRVLSNVLLWAAVGITVVGLLAAARM